MHIHMHTTTINILLLMFTLYIYVLDRHYIYFIYPTYLCFSECQVGYYSPGDGIPCQPCPANTVMNQPDYHKCNCSCLPNYFRYKAGVSRPNIPGITWPASNEGPSVGCTSKYITSCIYKYSSLIQNWYNNL